MSSCFWMMVVLFFLIPRLTSIIPQIIQPNTHIVASPIARSSHSSNPSSWNAVVNHAAVPCHHSKATSINAPAIGGSPNSGHKIITASRIPNTYCPHATTCAKENCGPAICRIFLILGILLPRNNPAKTTLIKTAGSVDRACNTSDGKSPVDHQPIIFPSTSGPSSSARNPAMIQLGR